MACFIQSYVLRTGDYTKECHKWLPDILNKVKGRLLERQIEATDAAIDKLVYELYGLTPEEIAIVEGSGK